MIGPEEIAARVAKEVALVRNPERRDLLLRLLVEPRREGRAWEYGAPGERYPYWVVAEAPDEGLILVYCEEGFGPEFPWGFLDTDGPFRDSLGMDSQWDWYLEAALCRSGLWRGPWALGERSRLPPAVRFRHRKKKPAPGPDRHGGSGASRGPN